nr:GNAT family N-acetyltransferase [Bacteroidota bacterium]
MNFRKFRYEDAGFCFETRCAAFIKAFNKELTPDVIKACLSVYSAADYIAMSNNDEVFIAENHWGRIGFFTIQRFDYISAEIPLIYFSLNAVRKGYGKQAMAFAEDWIRKNWPEVEKIMAQTIIPKYNSGFYRKLGYGEQGFTINQFGDKRVRAMVLEKVLG